MGGPTLSILKLSSINGKIAFSVVFLYGNNGIICEIDDFFDIMWLLLY